MVSRPKCPQRERYSHSVFRRLASANWFGNRSSGSCSSNRSLDNELLHNRTSVSKTKAGSTLTTVTIKQQLADFICNHYNRDTLN
jgi:hypothetical protein